MQDIFNSSLFFPYFVTTSVCFCSTCPSLAIMGPNDAAGRLIRLKILYCVSGHDA